MSLRCRLGLHRWDAWERLHATEQAPWFLIELLIRLVYLRRVCLRCGKVDGRLRVSK